MWRGAFHKVGHDLASFHRNPGSSSSPPLALAASVSPHSHVSRIPHPPRGGWDINSACLSNYLTPVFPRMHISVAECTGLRTPRATEEQRDRQKKLLCLWSQPLLSHPLTQLAPAMGSGWGRKGKKA